MDRDVRESGLNENRPQLGLTEMAPRLAYRYHYNPAMSQTTDAVLLVRPAGFGWNPETAASNAFQRQDAVTAGPAREAARAEFDGLAGALASAGVRVFALDEAGPDACPDAVFPNNWVSLHHDGTVVLYPMLAPSRRSERRVELVARLEEQGGYAVRRLVDLTHHELAGRFLEGTGSVVFDHVARVAYACRSPRSHEAVLLELCEEIGYEPVAFDATDAAGVPIYHTNVLLSIGSRLAIVCGAAIAGPQRDPLLERLQAGGRRVVGIDHPQMAGFAGNALELRTAGGAAVLALSATAWQAFGAAGRELLRDCVDLVVATPVPTIETLGGGSVRCMIAEVFLPAADSRRRPVGATRGAALPGVVRGRC